MIGFCGAQRVGKTTLASTLAERHGFKFIKTDVSSVFKDLGVSPKEELTFDQRLLVQQHILAYLIQLYDSLPVSSRSDCLVDRTPLDLYAYTIADIQRETAQSHELQSKTQAYLSECVEVFRRYFTLGFLVQPGIPYSEAEGSAAYNPLFMNHMTLILHGLMASLRHSHSYGPRCVVIPADVVDLNERVQLVRSLIYRLDEQAMLNSADSTPLQLH
ncbi:AAA family ATPase [Chitinibacter tainanensis]|uniref:AAA family ATPase n=1 Tax=Chitinibacter tainanensis TaxID=230667 RepID=UPI0003F93A85|nr:AAA family ATPase [Chitinibacter tainanensis]